MDWTSMDAVAAGLLALFTALTVIVAFQLDDFLREWRRDKPKDRRKGKNRLGWWRGK